MGTLVMDIARKVLKVLTVMTAGLVALIFPVMLFAFQGLGEIDLEAVVFLVSLYLIHPVSLVLIFMASFGKIAEGRPAHLATGFIALNAVCQLAVAAIIQADVIRGDSIIPILIAVPSFLYLLNYCIDALSKPGQAGGTS